MAQRGERPLRVFIFDSPRTRSHLFLRYLSTNPAFSAVYHPFIFSRWLGKDSHMYLTQNSQEHVQAMTQMIGDSTTAQCQDSLEKELSRIEAEGKHFLAAEHQLNMLKHDWMLNALRDQPFELPNNPTTIPDSIYETLSPVLLIRNPILQIRSVWQVSSKAIGLQPGDEAFKLCTSLKHFRIIYKKMKEQGKSPIIVDAEDLLWRTQELGEKLAKAWGIEHNFTDKWKPVSQAEWDGYPAIYPFIKDIAESDGVHRPAGGPKELVLENEFQVWSKSYGNDVAEHLKAYCLLNMPEYEYLVQFKI